MSEPATQQSASSLSARPSSHPEKFVPGSNRDIASSAWVDPLASLTGTHLITISDGALILPRAQLNASLGPLYIGPGAMVCEKAVIGHGSEPAEPSDGRVRETHIGKDTRIEAFARISHGVSIGEAAIVDSHVTFEEDVKTGAHSKTCHHVTLTKGTVVGDWEVVTETTNSVSGALGKKSSPRKRPDDEAGQKAEEYRLRAFQGEKAGLLASMRRTKAAEDQRKRQSARPPAKKP